MKEYFKYKTNVVLQILFQVFIGDSLGMYAWQQIPRLQVRVQVQVLDL